MTDRQSSAQYQWNGVAQYPSYNQNAYMPNNHHSPAHNTTYSDDSSYSLSSAYYPTNHCPSSPVYSPISPSDSDGLQRAPNPQDLHTKLIRIPSLTPMHHRRQGTTIPTRDPRSHSQAYPMHETISLSPPSLYQQIPLSPASPNAQFPGSARPFQCEVCGLSFNRQHDLKRHRDTHSGDKPFPCNGGCGKTFTRKDALKRHQVSCMCDLSESRADSDA
ncbi:hypothetical protein BKA70DRAFT_1369610 [Coprinopsis sp. MPI-PUGE-AT-0042]|nr:hypothetical protein BKA70DRAFT_1369610 [Coprinopsis sp. MPI-PUGE-AT-0042]